MPATEETSGRRVQMSILNLKSSKNVLTHSLSHKNFCLSVNREAKKSFQASLQFSQILGISHKVIGRILKVLKSQHKYVTMVSLYANLGQMYRNLDFKANCHLSLVSPGPLI